MMRSRKLINRRRIQCFAPGGIFAPGALGEMARYAHQFGATACHVSERQSLYFDLPDAAAAQKFRAAPAGRLFSDPVSTPNTLLIGAAIAAAEAAPGNFTPWLNESVYLDLCENFAHQNIKPRGAAVDLNAGRAPGAPDVFLGDAHPAAAAARCPADWNFLAAGIRHHWYVLRYAESTSSPLLAPFLLPSFLLAEVFSRFAAEDAADSFAQIQANFAEALLPAPAAEFAHEAKRESILEGFVAENQNSYSLGLFRESAGFSPLLLDELSYLARKHKVGRIYATHRHTLVVKNIPRPALPDWERLIARHGLNLRHDETVLHWQLADDTAAIRDRLLRALRQDDGGMAGLDFAIGPQACRSQAMIAIVPEGRVFFREQFAVYQRVDFARATPARFELHARCKGHRELETAVLNLCQRYYNHLALAPVAAAPTAALQIDSSTSELAAGSYRCRECLSVYEPHIGDVQAGIPAGTEFRDLPADYVCPVCEGPHSNFESHSARSMDLVPA